MSYDGAGHSLMAETFIVRERKLLGGTRHEYREDHKRYERNNSTAFDKLDGKKIESENFLSLIHISEPTRPY